MHAALPPLSCWLNDSTFQLSYNNIQTQHSTERETDIWRGLLPFGWMWVLKGKTKKYFKVDWRVVPHTFGANSDYENEAKGEKNLLRKNTASWERNEGWWRGETNRFTVLLWPALTSSHFPTLIPRDTSTQIINSCARSFREKAYCIVCSFQCIACCVRVEKKNRLALFSFKNQKYAYLIESLNPCGVCLCCFCAAAAQQESLEIKNGE